MSLHGIDSSNGVSDDERRIWQWRGRNYEYCTEYEYGDEGMVNGSVHMRDE